MDSTAAKYQEDIDAGAIPCRATKEIDRLVGVIEHTRSKITELRDNINRVGDRVLGPRNESCEEECGVDTVHGGTLGTLIRAAYALEQDVDRACVEITRLEQL